MYLIYMHTFPNGKSYIGQTKQTIKKRVGKNFSRYRGSTVFYNAIKKYGVKSISTKILYRCNTLGQANQLEIDAIKYHNTLHPHGYNLKAGGRETKNRPETLRKISKIERYLLLKIV